MALTGPIKLNEARGNERVYPVAANTKIYAGSAVALNSAGDAVEPSASATLMCVGVAIETIDNTGGAAGAKSVTAKLGCFGRKNSTGPDAISKADVGSNAYLVDGATVAKTSATNTRSIAGRISFIEDGLVYVNLGFGFAVY